MSAQELIFTVRFDDGSTAEARTWDPTTAAMLRKLVGGSKAARKRLRVRPLAEGDTAGHALADDTVGVNIALGYDVEGHTFALRLPSAAEAQRFQKRLLITGVLAASIVAGAAGAELATQSQAHIGPASGPAITVRAPSSNVTPATIDARLRDASAVSSTTTSPISPAKDAKDAAASGGSAATESTTDSGPGAPTNQTYPK